MLLNLLSPTPFLAPQGEGDVRTHTLHITTIPLIDRQLTLVISRPAYSTSPLVVALFVGLLALAIGTAVLIVWQMRLLQRVKVHHVRTLAETAKRVSAEEASRMKNMFISHLSHELRSVSVGVSVCLVCGGRVRFLHLLWTHNY